MVSSLAKNLDENILKWSNRKLIKDYPYLAVDDRHEDIRKEGVIISKAVLIVVESAGLCWYNLNS
jgi:transposase-like protein